ncbi:MAG: GNAT family N-acetyltransferase [Blastocatellia bacterium]|jgi:RimJ/RimL family protein N-acetyltransferase|nr:GNAT family N-acetyltransferase [Blastocatellia bacterium]MBK6425358.1 GNAT family N-acetyltransferase [Blastocatellia bacterium]
MNSNSIPTSFGSLRPWSACDKPSLVRYANNRKVWLNLRDSFPHPYTEASADAFLTMVGRQNPVTFFAMATVEEAVGGIGVSLGSDVHRLTAELGYWLAEPFWGRGIVSEAIAAFTEYTFDRFGLVRIHAEPYANNLASCRVLEKAGYIAEGRMRSSAIKDGVLVDQWMYAAVRQRA